MLLTQEKQAELERQLDDELKKKFPVEINEAALADVKVPTPAPAPEHGGGDHPANDARHPGADDHK
jgi:hypothetical protein